MRQRFIQHPVTHKLIPAEEYERPATGAAPMFIPDIQDYQSPTTRKWIRGRRQQREDLAQSNCRIAEPGEKKAFLTKPQDRDINWKF